MSFLDELAKNTNTARTENGAVTNASSLDACLDFFALAGAMRDRPQEAARLFERAYHTNKLTAIRTMFYLRDVRGGQGEKDIFYACLDKLSELDHATLLKVERFIPEYGSWKDYIVRPAKLELANLEFIAEQFKSDLNALDQGAAVSLLAKWLPSENASSKETRAKAHIIAKHLGMKPRVYRQALSKLRAQIKLLEHDMSARRWSSIEYSKLPSQAFKKHMKAFRRNDEERFSKFLEAAAKPKEMILSNASINTATLYTYEIYDLVNQGKVQEANALWNNLPDYTNGEDALVVADVSGSMYGRPMSVSVSLALYFAERNKGIMQNKFMTFSESPRLVDVIGDTLSAKMSMIERSEWAMNTDLMQVYRVIAQAAQRSNGEGVPKVVYIISDMEFDQPHGYGVRHDQSVFDNAKALFASLGAQMPHIVYWNVNARNTQVPVTKYDGNVTLISGLSPSTFSFAVGGKSPTDLMNQVVHSDRYQAIEI